MASTTLLFFVAQEELAIFQSLKVPGNKRRRGRNAYDCSAQNLGATCPGSLEAKGPLPIAKCRKPRVAQARSDIDQRSSGTASALRRNTPGALLGRRLASSPGQSPNPRFRTLRQDSALPKSAKQDVAGGRRVCRAPQHGHALPHASAGRGAALRGVRRFGRNSASGSVNLDDLIAGTVVVECSTREARTPCRLDPFACTTCAFEHASDRRGEAQLAAFGGVLGERAPSNSGTGLAAPSTAPKDRRQRKRT